MIQRARIPGEEIDTLKTRFGFLGPPPPDGMWIGPAAGMRWNINFKQQQGVSILLLDWLID